LLFISSHCLVQVPWRGYMPRYLGINARFPERVAGLLEWGLVDSHRFVGRIEFSGMGASLTNYAAGLLAGRRLVRVNVMGTELRVTLTGNAPLR
jgi:hypothetical protein